MPFDFAQESVRQAHHERLNLMVVSQRVWLIGQWIFSHNQPYVVLFWNTMARKLELDTLRIFLAPMEGLLDFVLRDILTRGGGVDLCVTEFVRVSGSALPKRSFHRIAPELLAGSLTPAGVPVRVQLLGSDPHFMPLNAHRLATLAPAGIDLNFGCPAKTVNRHEGGAILLREPERIHRLVQAVREAIPSTLPLSAKMRLGYADKSLAVACAKECNPTCGRCVFIIASK